MDMAGNLGFRIVFNHFGKVRRAVRQEVSAAIDRTCKAIEASAKRRVQDPPKTGRVYTRYGPKRLHQASAPGESPATDLGDLVKSITSRMESEMLGVVSVDAEHGIVMELGTVKTDRIAPRPFLGPAVEEERPTFQREVAEAIQRGSRRGA